MTEFTAELLLACKQSIATTIAWCVLPNHYHLLTHAHDLRSTIYALGRLHGRSSHRWNIEEACCGRKVFHRTADRSIRSEGHYWATVNYIHHNPVKHGYVARWTEWRWSSAENYLNTIGKTEAKRIWEMYPILDYGAGWDD